MYESKNNQVKSKLYKKTHYQRNKLFVFNNRKYMIKMNTYS